jgi:site-specific recombinase XerD
MKQLNNEFKTWLQTLGFSESSVKSLPMYTAEMFHYFETKGIKDITAEAMQDFFFQWKKRKNKRTGAGLGQNHISKGITAINNFIKFLKATEKNHINLKLEREKIQTKIPQVLTQQEIKALYTATYNNTKRVNTEAYGQRDRAMLAVYYGCGLRKNEGNNLLISDIQVEKKIIYVRKGKGSKERFVPIAEKGMQDIQEYLNYGRKYFVEQRQKKIKPTSDYFFINMHGVPMQDFALRIRALKEEANITKSFSLHTLRHSIATHLLQGGMDIEQIKKFLGHASLESTQLYTHIINEYEL